MSAAVSELAVNAIGLFFDILDVLISLLPSAPFRVMLSKLSDSSGMDLLGYINYFIPFHFCAVCFDLWLDCILAYYVYKYLKSGYSGLQRSSQVLIVIRINL